MDFPEIYIFVYIECEKHIVNKKNSEFKPNLKFFNEWRSLF